MASRALVCLPIFYHSNSVNYQLTYAAPIASISLSTHTGLKDIVRLLSTARGLSEKITLTLMYNNILERVGMWHSVRASPQVHKGAPTTEVASWPLFLFTCKAALYI